MIKIHRIHKKHIKLISTTNNSQNIYAKLLLKAENVGELLIFLGMRFHNLAIPVYISDSVLGICYCIKSRDKRFIVSRGVFLLVI